MTLFQEEGKNEDAVRGFSPMHNLTSVTVWMSCKTCRLREEFGVLACACFIHFLIFESTMPFSLDALKLMRKPSLPLGIVPMNCHELFSVLSLMHDAFLQVVILKSSSKNKSSVGFSKIMQTLLF